MAHPRIVDRGLQHAVLPDHKRELLGHLWDLDSLPERLTQVPGWGDSYLFYYKKQCEATNPNPQEELGISTHQNVVDIARCLHDPTATRLSVKNSLPQVSPDLICSNTHSRMLKSVNFVVRLWLMLDVGDYLGGFTPGQTQLQWGDETIRSLIESEFSLNPTLESRIKLEKTFTAYTLERVARIKIYWTNNLADHLRMMDDDKRVAVFHHAFFLQCHKTCQVFPSDFIDETLQTLALLLPEHDRKTKKWFRKYQETLQLDSLAMQCGQLPMKDRKIGNFKYWHDRLVILKEAFDNTEPKGVKQWWFDRRKRVQWYTFWVAVLVLILTVFFGVVQSIEGGIQAYAALYPAGS